MKPRAAVGVIIVLWLGVPAAVFAQLADAGANDQYVSAFFLKSDAADDWVGGVASKGYLAFGTDERLRATWQLDYGTLGEKRVSPTRTEAAKEAAVSKNSGAYTLTYARSFGFWRVTADGGVEHKRVAPAAGATELTHSVAPIGVASVRHIGSYARSATSPELAWAVHASLAGAKAIVPGGEERGAFFEPVAVLWFSVWTTTIPRPNQDPLQFYHLQFRGEAAGMLRLFEDGSQGHWDTSVVYFFTPANGVMLRRFNGYFDHNLRDRKNATTLSLVWKFR